MTTLPDLKIAGLDARRLNIIRQRWQTLDQHLSPWFPSDRPWFVTLRNLERHRQIHLIVTKLERVVESTKEHSSLSTNQSTEWQDRLLVPLARDLRLLADAEGTLIGICLRHGWFDLPSVKLREIRRPELTKVLPKVRSILRTCQTIEARAEALYQHHICCSKEISHKVAEELTDRHIIRHSIGLLLHLLSMYSTYGPIGLLSQVRDTAASELLLLEDQIVYIEALTSQAQNVLGAVRRDIITLHDGLQSVQPSLWQPHLFNEPLHSDARSYYRKRIYRRLRRRIVEAIVKQRGCDEATAEQLFDCFIQKGLPGMVEWRAGLETVVAQNAFERHRLLAALTLITVGMAPWARQECERLVEHLLVAVRAVELPNSLQPLLVEYPSSPLRRRWGRRFWFGLPAILRRKQRRRRVPRIRGSCVPKTQPQTNQQPKQQSREDELVTKFAELAQLDEQDARNRVRNFLTYGVLGLLPRGQWRSVLDPRLVSWLQLIKMGRLEGTIAWSTVLHVAGEYVRLLGIPRPSAQVLRAVFNSIAKPSYWHGGKGKAVDGVRQRVTLKLNSRPRLHNIWFVLPIALNVSSGTGKTTAYQLLLIVDEGSGLPVGGWLSETKLGLRELGLALYQSIWHPQIIDWPLHGIPEIIRIPAELLRGEVAQIEEQATRLLQHVSNLDEQQLAGKTAADQLRFHLLSDQTNVAYVLNQRNSPVDRALRWLTEGDVDTVREHTLPQLLLPEGLHDINSAAKFLITRLEIVDKISLEGKPAIRALRDKLRKQGAQVVAQAINIPNPSLGIALRDLFIWLQDECFPKHRVAPVPGEIAKYGVGTAGWDTLAAGWLLPPNEEITADDGSVAWQMHRYRLDQGQIETGTRVMARAYPFAYSRRSANDRDTGIFCEIGVGPEKRLIYMDCVS